MNETRETPKRVCETCAEWALVRVVKSLNVAERKLAEIERRNKKLQTENDLLRKQVESIQYSYCMRCGGGHTHVMKGRK